MEQSTAAVEKAIRMVFEMSTGKTAYLELPNATMYTDFCILFRRMAAELGWQNSYYSVKREKVDGKRMFNYRITITKGTNL